MKKKILLVSALGLLVALSAIIPLSCGGNGDDSETTPTPLAEPATLNQKNVDDVLEFIAENVSGCSLGATATKTQYTFEPFVDLTLHMGNQLKSVSRQVYANATQTTMEFEGACGGTATVSLTSDEETGSVSGSLSFDNFCQDVDESEFLISGDLTFSGLIDTSTGDITQLSGSTGPEGITLQLDENSYTIGIENASIGIGEDTITATVGSFYIKTASDGEVKEYRVDNLSFQATEVDNTTEITASGQFTHPDEGMVSFSTPQPITISDDDKIVSGQLEVTGANNTKALLTVIDSNIFEVQVDTDGDGVYDYFPDNLDCSEFDLNLDLDLEL